MFAGKHQTIPLPGSPLADGSTAHQVPNYTIETQLFDDLFEGKDRNLAWYINARGHLGEHHSSIAGFPFESPRFRVHPRKVQDEEVCNIATFFCVCGGLWFFYLGVSIVMGVPPNGWFLMENPI